ncbi:hypothetical protein MRX96_006443 [Rhipicephalus microplus]
MAVRGHRHAEVYGLLLLVVLVPGTGAAGVDARGADFWFPRLPGMTARTQLSVMRDVIVGRTRLRRSSRHSPSLKPYSVWCWQNWFGIRDTVHFVIQDNACYPCPTNVHRVPGPARDVNGVYYTDEMDSSAEDLQATLGDSSTSDEQEVAAYEEAGFAADNTGWKVVSSRKTKKERAETTAKLMQQQNHPSSGQWAHDDNERSRSNKVRQSWRKTTDRARSIYVEDVDTQPLPFSIAEPHTCEDVDHKQ